jgi:hypothetical protein
MKKVLKNNMAGIYNLSMLILLFTYPIADFTGNSANGSENNNAKNSSIDINKSALRNDISVKNMDHFIANPIFGTNDAIMYKELHYKKINVIIPFLNH